MPEEELNNPWVDVHEWFDVEANRRVAQRVARQDLPVAAHGRGIVGDAIQAMQEGVPADLVDRAMRMPLPLQELNDFIPLQGQGEYEEEQEIEWHDPDEWEDVALKPDTENKWGPFDNYDQAVQHIYGRVVIYGDTARYVSKIDSPKANVGQVLLQELGGRDYEAKDITDPLFNGFKFDPLGFVNIAASPVFLWLKPIRQTHRGYGQENVGIFEFSLENNGMSVMSRVGNYSYTDVMKSDSFSEMLNDDFPTLLEASRECMAHTDFGIAVGRRYCVHSDGEGFVWLWRNDIRVGLLQDRASVLLGKKYKFLKEELGEDKSFQGVWVK